MERLIWHVAIALSNRGHLEVIGPEGCRSCLPEAVGTREVPWRPLHRFLLAGTMAAIRAATGSFDLVVAGSGLTAPLAWLAARLARARFAVYLHGLDVVAPSAVYQRCWLPFIRRADLVLVNSGNTRRLAIGKGVRPRTIEILHPGVGFPDADDAAAAAYRVEHGLCDRRILLSVGRLTPRKGLAAFIEHALPALHAKDPGVVLLVIGADATDAARPETASEELRIKLAARASGLADAVRLLPHCDDAVLSAAYRAADVHVFPVLDLPGDVEGFGMVAIEAAAHGLPTVAFAVGGVPDAVLDGTSGTLVPPGDYGGMVAAIGEWMVRDRRDVSTACVAAADDYRWDRFHARLHSLASRLTAGA